MFLKRVGLAVGEYMNAVHKCGAQHLRHKRKTNGGGGVTFLLEKGYGVGSL